ncbi:hypothetical protein MYXA107069_20900 [Myxococcus xanthus]|nr:MULTISPECIES: hypothetical protein [Myxococcus]SDY21935.1 hypothetical protein SAMN05444383_1258 [Myxococcus xanthus]
MLRGHETLARQQRLRWTEVDVRPPPNKQARCALLEGFSLHANTLLHANDRQGLERRCRYGRAVRWRWSGCHERRTAASPIG